MFPCSHHVTTLDMVFSASCAFEIRLLGAVSEPVVLCMRLSVGLYFKQILVGAGNQITCNS